MTVGKQCQALLCDQHIYFTFVDGAINKSSVAKLRLSLVCASLASTVPGIPSLRNQRNAMRWLTESSLWPCRRFGTAIRSRTVAADSDWFVYRRTLAAKMSPTSKPEMPDEFLSLLGECRQTYGFLRIAARVKTGGLLAHQETRQLRWRQRCRPSQISSVQKPCENRENWLGGDATMTCCRTAD